MITSHHIPTYSSKRALPLSLVLLVCGDGYRVYWPYMVILSATCLEDMFTKTIPLYTDLFNKEMCSWNIIGQILGNSLLGVQGDVEEMEGHASGSACELWCMTKIYQRFNKLCYDIPLFSRTAVFLLFWEVSLEPQITSPFKEILVTPWNVTESLFHAVSSSVINEIESSLIFRRPL